MPDIHYEHPKLAGIYDLDSGWSADREFYLALADDTPKNILDLGCGTGLICNAYAAKGHDVTGVDPAVAMLDVARRKPHGKDIEWVQSSAQDYRSDKRFDLIIMTGHAFQVLLEDAGILATFKTMRRHLKPGGRIVFESRNPEIDWVEKWGQLQPYMLKESDILATLRVLGCAADRISFEWLYQFPDETLVSRSTLRFLSCGKIEAFLARTGLVVEKLFGDWDETRFDEKTSEEMIFVVKTA